MTETEEANTVDWERRKFLWTGLAGIAGVSMSSFPIARLLKPSRQELYLGVLSRGQNENFVGIIRMNERRLDLVRTPLKGHSVIQVPGNAGNALLLPYRGGQEAFLIDLDENKIIHSFKALKGFYGHGAFSPDGKLLFSTESHPKTGEGMIGVRDARTFSFLGEFPSYGYEPHETKMSPDGKSLIIANSGIAADPLIARGQGRQFNEESVESCITWVNIQSGRLVKTRTFPNPQQSMRHLCVLENGDVATGALLVKKKDNRHSHLGLGAILSQNKESVIELHGDGQFFKNCGDYILSIAAQSDKKLIAMTHPYGKRISFWNSDTGDLVHLENLNEAPMGIVMTPNHATFLITTGSGNTYSLNSDFSAPAKKIPKLRSPFNWEAHLTLAELS